MVIERPKVHLKSKKFSCLAAFGDHEFAPILQCELDRLGIPVIGAPISMIKQYFYFQSLGSYKIMRTATFGIDSMYCYDNIILFMFSFKDNLLK